MKKVFVTREFNKSASEITKAEFIQMMSEDIAVAIAEYRVWSAEEAEKKYQADNESYKIRRAEKIAHIVDNSYKKYKREFYRLRYVESEIAKLPENLDRSSWSWYNGQELKSIRWDIEPWNNGGAYSMSLTDSDRLNHTLGYIYEVSIKNKYFNQCSGWSIVEDFNTEFKLHLSAELQEQWKADEHNLAESISRFYEGCTYWGD